MALDAKAANQLVNLSTGQRGGEDTNVLRIRILRTFVDKQPLPWSNWPFQEHSSIISIFFFAQTETKKQTSL